MESAGDSGGPFGISANAAAARMAEHDDVVDAQYLDRKFERCEHAVTGAVGRERRHGDVTDNEQLTGMRIEDDLWRGA